MESDIREMPQTLYQDKGKPKPRVAIVWPAPYSTMVPLLNVVHSRTTCYVFFFCKSVMAHPEWNMDQVLKQAQFKYTFLPGFLVKGIHFRPSVIWYLLRFRPEVTVANDFFPQTLFTLIYSRLFGSKIIIHSNATTLSGATRPNRRWFRKWLMRHCDGFIAASSETKKYLHELGAKTDKILTSVQTMDVLRWKYLVEWEKQFRENLKEELGLNERVVLYVGRVESAKGVQLLLQAFHSVVQAVQNVSMLIVGSGSAEAELKGYCDERGLSDTVVFVGHKQPDELPQYYASADLFVFPTLGDTFGFVVNEALASGLPVICSPFAGARDLIDEGKNGYILDPRDTRKLAALLVRILTDEPLAQSLKQNALASIENFTIEKSAEQFLEAIGFIMRASHGKAD